jgi:hypothetical protein
MLRLHHHRLHFCPYWRLSSAPKFRDMSHCLRCPLSRTAQSPSLSRAAQSPSLCHVLRSRRPCVTYCAVAVPAPTARPVLTTEQSDALQVWTADASMVNKKSRTAYKGCSCTFQLGGQPVSLHCKGRHVVQRYSPSRVAGLSNSELKVAGSEAKTVERVAFL